VVRFISAPALFDRYIEFRKKFPLVKISYAPIWGCPSWMVVQVNRASWRKGNVTNLHLFLQPAPPLPVRSSAGNQSMRCGTGGGGTRCGEVSTFCQLEFTYHRAGLARYARQPDPSLTPHASVGLVVAAVDSVGNCHSQGVAKVLSDTLFSAWSVSAGIGLLGDRFPTGAVPALSATVKVGLIGFQSSPANFRTSR